MLEYARLSLKRGTEACAMLKEFDSLHASYSDNLLKSFAEFKAYRSDSIFQGGRDPHFHVYGKDCPIKGMNMRRYPACARMESCRIQNEDDFPVEGWKPPSLDPCYVACPMGNTCNEADLKNGLQKQSAQWKVHVAKVDRELKQVEKLVSAFTHMKPPVQFASSPVCVGESIVNPPSGKCLDIDKSSKDDGTKVQLFHCTGNGNQKWELRSDQLVNPQSGKCLDVDKGSQDDGTKVQLFHCIGKGSQKWELRGDQFLNPQSGKCLDINKGSKDDGAEVQLFRCTGNGNQKWSLSSASASVVFV